MASTLRTLRSVPHITGGLTACFLLVCAWALTDDQACVELHRGRCVDYHQCATANMLSVCSKSEEVCCKADRTPGGAEGTPYPTARVPLYMTSCAATVDSEVGSLWVFADGRKNTLYLYPDLTDSYYDCNRFIKIDAAERFRLAHLQLQVGTAIDGSLRILPTSPGVEPVAVLTQAHYEYERPPGWPHEDVLYPLAVRHDTLVLNRACSAPLPLLLVATLTVQSSYKRYNITAMGGIERLPCDSTLLEPGAEHRELCDARDYHLVKHKYLEGCSALGDPQTYGPGACESACTSARTGADGKTRDTRGLCMDSAQCAQMGAMPTDKCALCGGASGVCCVFAPTPSDEERRVAPAPHTPSAIHVRPGVDPASHEASVHTPVAKKKMPPVADDSATFFGIFFAMLLLLCVATVVLRILYRRRARRLQQEAAYAKVSKSTKTQDTPARRTTRKASSRSGGSNSFSARFENDNDDSFVDLEDVSQI